MSVFLALGCLVCSALNDFLFKLFAGEKGSRGLFVALVGCIWMLALSGMPMDWSRNFGATVLWGGISGIFSLTANVFLIEAMERQSAGICSTVYRLNLVAVVIGACWLLEESLNWMQECGVLLAIAAVCCFLSRQGETNRRAAGIGLGLVLAASLLRAAMGLSYKYGFLRGADPNGVVLINSFFWISGGIVYCFCKRESLRTGVSRRLLGFGILSGILVTGIVYFMAAALNCGRASVVLPIAQMSFLGTLLLSTLILKEKLTRAKCLGIVCGLAAILLLSL